jgi:ferredoxin
MILDRDDVDLLFTALAARGYSIIGPTIRDGVVVLDELSGVDDLPIGWGDAHAPGSYRTVRRADDALFGYTLGPHSWKRFLHQPRLMLWHARHGGDRFEVVENVAEPRRLALVGVRPCELRAIAIQDEVFLRGPFIDPQYAARRSDLVIVAVSCTEPGETCFCTSMSSGPRAHDGYDLALTEVIGAGRHHFFVDAGSPVGEAICDELVGCLALRAATDEERAVAQDLTARAADRMGRSLDTTDIRDRLYDAADSPRWAHTAERCLTCGNCTMVCPTCFCTTVEDVTDLAGERAERWRRWDSCFSVEFSHLHGGSVRTSARARYRHWITHKLASWIDQFGTSGCVGCGRCITWCPAGIDITEEVRALNVTGESWTHS